MTREHLKLLLNLLVALARVVAEVEHILRDLGDFWDH